MKGLARRGHAWPAALLFLCVPHTAPAQLTVIYDSGQTRPLAPYLDILDDAPRESAPPPAAESGLGVSDVRNLLPIRSPGLTSGQVRTRVHTRPLSRPVFLIGSGTRSRQWLVRNRARLKASGAVGLLVQAETMDDLRAMTALADDLPLMPVSGSDLARALGLAHYPALITSRGIEQ